MLIPLTSISHQWLQNLGQSLSSPSTSIGPGSSQIHTVDVTVPINESASSYDLVVVLTSEDGTTSSTATMPLRVARPILTFFDDWSSEPSQPLEGTMHNYSVTVFNTGLVQADDTVIEIVRLSGTPGAEVLPLWKILV